LQAGVQRSLAISAHAILVANRESDGEGALSGSDVVRIHQPALLILIDGRTGMWESA
jgi:hypothetical protein